MSRFNPCNCPAGNKERGEHHAPDCPSFTGMTAAMAAMLSVSGHKGSKAMTDKQKAEDFIAFMKAMKGVTAHQAATALSNLTPGIDWRGCGKKHLAASWRDRHGASGYSELLAVTPDKLRAEIVRMAGIWGWEVKEQSHD